MSHPQMFDDDDPLLDRVRTIALGLPEAKVKVSHGRPAFFTGTVFCYDGGAIKVDGVWVQHPRSVLVRPPLTEGALLSPEPAARASSRPSR